MEETKISDWSKVKGFDGIWTGIKLYFCNIMNDIASFKLAFPLPFLSEFSRYTDDWGCCGWRQFMKNIGYWSYFAERAVDVLRVSEARAGADERGARQGDRGADLWRPDRQRHRPADRRRPRRYRLPNSNKLLCQQQWKNKYLLSHFCCSFISSSSSFLNPKFL